MADALVRFVILSKSRFTLRVLWMVSRDPRYALLRMHPPGVTLTPDKALRPPGSQPESQPCMACLVWSVCAEGSVSCSCRKLSPKTQKPRSDQIWLFLREAAVWLPRHLREAKQRQSPSSCSLLHSQAQHCPPPPTPLPPCSCPSHPRPFPWVSLNSQPDRG